MLSAKKSIGNSVFIELSNKRGLIEVPGAKNISFELNNRNFCHYNGNMTFFKIVAQMYLNRMSVLVASMRSFSANANDPVVYSVMLFSHLFANLKSLNCSFSAQWSASIRSFIFCLKFLIESFYRRDFLLNLLVHSACIPFRLEVLMPLLCYHVRIGANISRD